MENKYTVNDYRKAITRIGLVFTTFCLIVNYVPALYVSLTSGVFPTAGQYVALWLAAAAAFGAGWFVQPISFFPMIGLAGTFICWICGNVGDLRAPSATMAQKAVGAEQGTIKADIIATLGICASIFTSVTIITIFAIIGAQVMPMLPPFVKKALTFVLPGVLGAVYSSMSVGPNLKLGVLCLIVCFIGKVVCPMLHIPGAFLMLINIVLCVLVARIYFLTVMKGGKE